MSVNFFDLRCQQQSSSKLFGLCDDQPPPAAPAYIDEVNGAGWIAVIVNEDGHLITFTAIDHCIEIRRPDGSMNSRCDGMLNYGQNIIFVELKERKISQGAAWAKDADDQLRSTIAQFEKSDDAEAFVVKKAYACNSLDRKFKQSQTRRMEQFYLDTGYVLRFEQRIIL